MTPDAAAEITPAATPRACKESVNCLYPEELAQIIAVISKKRRQ
jgi:hypothetical protein